MLMIDGVELILVDETLKMGKLERDHTIRSYHVRHSRRKVIKIGDLCQHVVADDEISRATLRHYLSCERQAKKLNEGRNIPLLRGFGYIGSRLDTNYPDTQRQEVLKQISIVASDL